jgi:hypothetical protein
MFAAGPQLLQGQLQSDRTRCSAASLPSRSAGRAPRGPICSRSCVRSCLWECGWSCGYRGHGSQRHPRHRYSFDRKFYERQRQAQAGSHPQRGWRSLRTSTASTLLTPAGQSYSPHPATWNVPQEILRAQQLAPSRTAEIRPAEELNDGVEEGGCRQFLWWMTTMLHSTGRPAHITTPG